MAQEFLMAMEPGLSMAAEWGRNVWDFVGTNAANIIALTVAGLVAYQAWLMRRHNRLSVRPHLQTYTGKLADVLAFSYSLYLRNDGLGPAVITKWTVYLDGEAQTLPTANDVDSFVKGLAPRYTSITTRFIGENEVMRANDSQPILSIKLLPINADKTAFEEQLERVDLVVEYTSMYGEKLKPLDTRKLPNRLHPQPDAGTAQSCHKSTVI